MLPKKKSDMTSSASERRKKFRDWISVEQLRHEGSLPYYLGGGPGEVKLTNVMKNIDRKKMCLPLDESLEPLPCDICNKVEFLHLIYKDGVSTYKCQECLDGKKEAKAQEGPKEVVANISEASLGVRTGTAGESS